MEGFTYITSITEMGRFQDDLMLADKIGFDIETTGLDPFLDEVTLIQFSMNKNIYILNTLVLGDGYTKYFLRLVDATHKMIIGHAIDFDLRFIKRKYGILFENVYDTMLAERMINNGLDKTQYYALKLVVSRYCDVDLDKDVRTSFIDNKEITEEKLVYAANDVRYLNAVYLKQMATLTEQKQLDVLNLECKVEPIVVSMELEGISINRKKWESVTVQSKEKAKKLKADLIDRFITDAMTNLEWNNTLDLVDLLELPVKGKAIRNNLSTVTNEEFVKSYLKSILNIDSHKQMLAILTKVYKIKKLKDTNEKTINKVSDSNPIINTLLSYREAEKEVSTFDTGYLDKIHPFTGRLHTTYHQLGAITGRFSSSDPNLQNIKGKDEEDMSKYRPCIEAREGWKLISSDYSQQELRILAEVTRDPRMLETFEKKQDPHKVTAVGLFEGTTYDTVTNKQRAEGKHLNFAINYGTTEWGLARNFDIPMVKGKEYIEKYFKFYSVYNQFIKEVNESIWEHGYSITMFGRKRFFTKQILFEDGWKATGYKDRLLRSLRNHIIQGTGADITKMALCNLYYNNPFGDKFRIVLQVHDEIVVECEEEIAEKAKIFVEEQMLSAERYFLKVVESAVDAHISDHWEH
jgi:DNA polymerase I-like protein with 3'-5' exonuclease and polymerase domains